MDRKETRTHRRSLSVMLRGFFVYIHLQPVTQSQGSLGSPAKVFASKAAVPIVYVCEG